ncbi:MAG: type IV secretory system conjugative DNA transfer family protein [Burkholderiaceae bacterium]|jgi:type IV secretion system protein VirD4|nr:type IV secretory system conjugative DNA transfer family protein [Burkholderiaceae bacterium]
MKKEKLLLASRILAIPAGILFGICAEKIAHLTGAGPLLLGACLLAAMSAALIWKQKNRVRRQRDDTRDYTPWATSSQIEATGLLADEKNAGGVLLGASHGGGRSIQHLCSKAAEHILVVGRERSGKSVGIVIPTLLSWDQSVLVYDIAGESWELTSGFRERVLGQRCIRFAPSQEGSARFNPLDAIRMDQNLVNDVQNIVAMIVDPDGKDIHDHWFHTSFNLLAGSILYVLLEEKIRQKSLESVGDLLVGLGDLRQTIADEAGNGNTSRAAMSYMVRAANEKLKKNDFPDTPCGQAERDGWKLVAQTVGGTKGKESTEYSAVLSMSLRLLRPYCEDSIIAQNTATSDFSIDDLMGGGFNENGQPRGPKVSLYIVAPPHDKDRIRPLTRLILHMTLRRLTEGNPDSASKSGHPHRLLFLIDDFPSLGKLNVLEQALALTADYGFKALLTAQSLAQLQEAYGKDSLIIPYCNIRLRLSKDEIIDWFFTGENTAGYELLVPDAYISLPPDDELVFMAGHSPIHCQKIKYYADPQLKECAQMGAATSNEHNPNPP